MGLETSIEQIVQLTVLYCVFLAISIHVYVYESYGIVSHYCNFISIIEFKVISVNAALLQNVTQPRVELSAYRKSLKSFSRYIYTPR